MVILVAMVLGIAVGLIVGEPAGALEPIGQVFVRLLVTTAVPLVAANLLTGITGLSDLALMGRVGGRFAIFFLVSTVAAILLGVVCTAWLSPGVRVAAAGAASAASESGKVPGLGDFLFNLVPNNIVAAFAEGQVPQIIIFTLLLGAAALLSPADVRMKIHAGASVVDAVLRKLVALIMFGAPIGIGALAASAAAEFGTQMLSPLALFMASVWSAQALVVVLMLAALWLVARVPPGAFLKATAPLYATAAATCSSLASLAVATRMAEDRLKVPRAVYSLTLPLGSQLSKEGTAAMLSAALMFTVQGAGVEFRLVDYATIVVMTCSWQERRGASPVAGWSMCLATSSARRSSQSRKQACAKNAVLEETRRDVRTKLQRRLSRRQPSMCHDDPRRETFGVSGSCPGLSRDGEPSSIVRRAGAAGAC